MPFDWKGALAGFISPETASSNYFQTRELKKRLAIEQEAKDAAADKAKESERMDIAAAVGPEEIAPGVVRPSYINAAILQAERTAAPVQTSANQFTTARAVAPDTARMGKLSAEANMAESIAHERQQRLAASDADIALGNQDLRSKLFTSGSTAKIARADADVAQAGLDKLTSEAGIKADIPRLGAAFQAGDLAYRTSQTAAKEAAGLPVKEAGAAAAKAELDTQDAEQTRALEKLYPEELSGFRAMNAKAKISVLKAAAAKAGNERVLSLIKSGALESAIDPVTGVVDWKKMEELGLSRKEVAELSVGILRGGNMMQNLLGHMMPDLSVNPYTNRGNVGLWGDPSKRGTTATTPTPGPKVVQKTTAFDAMKSR